MSAIRIFEEVLGRAAPAHLDLLERCLGMAGAVPCPPDEATLPLMTPLAHDATGRIGLLHWPTPEPSDPVPVVRQRGWHLELLAPSVRGWLRHHLARLEALGTLEPDLAAAAQEVYDTGERATTGLPWDAWVLLKGEGSLEAYDALRARHVARGDTTAALIAAERAAARFPGWAEPHRWRHGLLTGRGEREEARDAAVAALALPTWTLSGDFVTLARAIGWQDPVDGAPYGRLAADPARLPADRAAHLLDQVTVDRLSWPTHRPALAALYDEADLPGVARLVRGA